MDEYSEAWGELGAGARVELDAEGRERIVYADGSYRYA